MAKEGCFPNVTYQLRKVYILESSPIDGNHPISKRRHFVDAQNIYFTKNHYLCLPELVNTGNRGWLVKPHPDHSFLAITKARVFQSMTVLEWWMFQAIALYYRNSLKHRRCPSLKST